jgi:hypothetical protein
MKRRDGFRPIRLATIVRAERMGWRWSQGPRGRVLLSKTGAWELRMLPLSARRFEEHAFKDAA